MLDIIGEALSGLDDVLSLKRPLSADSPAAEEDVLAVKKDLRRSGYYDEPDYGLTPYPDKPLFDGIRAFQKDNKLTVDGVMKPGGETETALNRARIAQADPLEARAQDENIVRQFIRAKNEERTQSEKSDSAPPVPPKGSQSLKEPEKAIDKFFGKIEHEEGGYTTGKKDRKGPTNIGINRDTLSEYETWKKSRGEDLPASFTKEINKVTPALAKQIYNEMYYKRYNLDKIENQGVAEHLLDITINQGPYNGAVWLQEALNEELAINMKVDGTIGPTTRKAIQEAERKGRLDYVHNRIIEKRKNHYKDLAEKDPSQKDFLKGWLNRAESFRGGE